MNMSSVLTLDLVGEARAWNSVWLFIDAFNAFVYAATAEKKTQTCINFHSLDAGRIKIKPFVM